MGWSGHQEGQRVSGPSFSQWSDSEIRIFLMEWEVVEQEMGHPGRKIHKKTRALCQRLYQRGLKKNWQSCFNLLVSLQNLHRILCSERPLIEMVFSSLVEAQYRVLGHRLQGSRLPERLCDWVGIHLISRDLQSPMALPSPMYQPWDYGISVPSGEPEVNSSPMILREESLVPRWDPWNPSYPLTVPHLFPAFFPGDANPHQLCSASDENQGPQ
ncbi:putative uncharacterized protein MSANTD5 [Mesocricetus auratus]|uniref:Myb/SANT-like DNA-binding domain-containing protein 1 n=1 Tax=Mesocricetus auratus TaxID=10036 RepID=A0ABM2X0I5_MESAU|nr:putative uncharacterized protein MSANTD5 [Mesocricetus auratus]